MCRNVEVAKHIGRIGSLLSPLIWSGQRFGKYDKVDDNLKDLRISAIVLLGFAGFCRFKELASIRTSHLVLRQISTGKAIRLLSHVQAMSLVHSIWSLDMCLLQRRTIIHPAC